MFEGRYALCAEGKHVYKIYPTLRSLLVSKMLIYTSMVFEMYSPWLQKENSYQYVETDRSKSLTTDSYFRFYLNC